MFLSLSERLIVKNQIVIMTAMAAWADDNEGKTIDFLMIAKVLREAIRDSQVELSRSTVDAR